MTKDGGIGLNGRMAWYCKEDLKLFKEKTMGGILIMGRKTVENLPHLSGREIWCVTRDENLDTSDYKNGVRVFKSLDSVWSKAMAERKRGRNVFCAGGAEIYKQLSRPQWRTSIDEYHISFMKENYECDAFFQPPDLDPRDWVITEKRVRTEFRHYVYKGEDILHPNDNTPERNYLDLIRDVLLNGTERQGRNGKTKSLFGKHLHFDLTKGFPLLTTKRMFWRGVVEELLFFLRGFTDSKILEEKKINIWKGNTNREFLDSHGLKHYDEGMMGPMYGWQWRHFGADYDSGRKYEQLRVADPDGTCINVYNQRQRFKRVASKGFDQLTDVIDKIRNDPQSRRILMTDYNPAQASKGVLYPCHSLMLQFYVDGDNLDMYCFNRSSDLFLGLPFNIASSSLLLSIIAWTTGKRARHFHLSLGDAHIYEQHIDAVKEQLSRIPCKFPTLVINREVRNVEDIERLEVEDFVLQDYICHPSIKAEMIA
jgi:dihydrofolate reductase/thymidylate synthase